MSAALKLFGHGLAQALGHESLQVVTDVLINHFTDSSLGVSHAIEKAHDNAWKALVVALGGDSLLARFGRLLQPADFRGFRESVRTLLEQTPLPAGASVDTFRLACLAEIRTLRANRPRGLGVGGKELAEQTAAFCRYHDPHAQLQRGWEAVAAIADAVAGDYPTVATFLKLQVPSSPPLLAVAFHHFLHCEISGNERLARRFQYQGMLEQGKAQHAAFATLTAALGQVGDRFDGLLERLDRIEDKIDETREAVNRLVELVQRIADAPAPAGQQRDIRLVVSADDHRDVDLLLKAREAYRRLPPTKQTASGWMLIADSLSAAGLAEEAQEDHLRVAELAPDDALKAGALFKSYRELCGAGRWEQALAAYQGASELAPGVRLIPERYEPVAILGSGAFGTVFLCHDQREDPEHRQVAVKAIHTGSPAVSIERVFREAQSLRRINHPAIIGVLHWDYAGPGREQRPYIVMEYFEGGSLADHLGRHGRLSPAELVEVALRVAQGMKGAHDAGVLHRDLKPENLLVRKRGERWEVKIVDFGLAVKLAPRQTQQTNKRLSRRSEQQFFTGTYRYAPPEQRGEGETNEIGPHSDVYSFGKTCCEALFGTTEPRSWDFAALPSGLSALAQVLERCIADRLEHRLADFGKVLEVLDPLSQRGGSAPRGEKPLQATDLPLLRLPALTSEPNEATGRIPGEELTLRVQPPGSLFRKPAPLALRFVYVPPGRFTMGSPEAEPLRSPGEKARPVRLTRGYFLAAGPVTLGQFRTFIRATGYRPRSDVDGCALRSLPQERVESGAGWQAPGFTQADSHPVTCVSFADATAFCSWLARESGKAVRLPTEAEWEHACRAGSATAFSLGETVTTAQANYNGSGVYPGGRRGEFRRATTPVGSFPANAWGLFDMHGNVREWCQDNYRDLLPEKEAVDPLETTVGNRRVVRGGSWNDLPQHCRCAARSWQIDTSCCDTVGFRVAFVEG
jgi:formylglycine-generating enzyme required for sulfatase activity/tetratricopeptide (TPR) repeat protein